MGDLRPPVEFLTDALAAVYERLAEEPLRAELERCRFLE
jgi:hypothetical protein